jgi:hypothetical protein
MGKDNNYNRQAGSRRLFLGSFLSFVFQTYSWVCSVPMWLNLDSAFRYRAFRWWFFATLAAWLLAGVIRYCVLVFARWGTRTAPQNKEWKIKPLFRKDGRFK